MDNSVIPASIVAACDEVAASLVGVTSEQLLAANAAAFAECWSASESPCAIGEADVLDVSLEAWRRAVTACGCDPELGFFAFETHQRIGNEMARLFDDVPAFLERVSQMGLQTALVTNSSVRSQSLKIEVVGLHCFFDAIVISGAHGTAKPDPAIFQIALDALECDPGHAWHIGDSLSTDVAGAVAAGLTSVWINRDGQQAPTSDPIPDIEVTSLDQVWTFFD